MDKTNLDTLDNEIVELLTENGRMPIGEMAKRKPKVRVKNSKRPREEKNLRVKNNAARTEKS